MNALKNYTIIIFTVMLIALAGAYKITKNNLVREKANSARLSQNQERLMNDSLKNVEITLTQKEWLKQKSDSIRELEKANKIKPKSVIRYVERTHTEEITVPKVVPISMVSKDTWEIKDSTKCFVWKGIARKVGESLLITRTYFGYQNTSQELLHREKKGKFLFWDTYYKNRFTLTGVDQCGSSTSKTVNIVKE